MTNKLQTIEGSSSVRDAARKMRDKNISSLVVMNSSNKPIGIITERDLVRKVCANDSSSKNTNVKDILSYTYSFRLQDIIAIYGTIIKSLKTYLD